MAQEYIGIVAGTGQFPRMVAEAAHAAGYRVAICGFIGHSNPELEHLADAWQLFPIGQLNKQITFFTSLNVKKLCFAGAISKPKALEIRPDWRAAKLIFRLRSTGDDVLLRAIIGEIESEGIQVMQAAELLPELRAGAGVLTSRAPTDEEWKNICYGWRMARAVGKLDIGQCIVVQRGMVVAVEALEGTDATLRRGGELGGDACIAVKMAKPEQDQRIDLPSLGLNTVKLLAEYRYSCLVYEAGKTLFFDRDASVAAANAAGICIIGVDDDAVAARENPSGT